MSNPKLWSAGNNLMPGYSQYKLHAMFLCHKTPEPFKLEIESALEGSLGKHAG